MAYVRAHTHKHAHTRFWSQRTQTSVCIRVCVWVKYGSSLRNVTSLSTKGDNVAQTLNEWLHNGVHTRTLAHTHTISHQNVPDMSHSCYLHGRIFPLTNRPDEVRLNPHSHLVSSRNILSLSSLLCLSLSLLLLSLCLLSLTSRGSRRGNLLGISFFKMPRVWSFILTLSGSFLTTCRASLSTTELARSAKTPRGRLPKRFTHSRPLATREVLLH